MDEATLSTLSELGDSFFDPQRVIARPFRFVIRRSELLVGARARLERCGRHPQPPEAHWKLNERSLDQTLRIRENLAP